jgi:putative ATP-dependent endonuclease of OLD family
MQLEAVTIERFRSIESVTIPQCGAFNVFIGRNNSGKSNILSAIDLFFRSLRSGKVVSFVRPKVTDIDFYERQMRRGLTVTAEFSLALAERDVLLRDIVTEAPQMKHAVDGIDPSLWLSVSMTVMPPPKSFVFISEIRLSATRSASSITPGLDRSILNVSVEAASELYEKLVSATQHHDQARTLTNSIERVTDVFRRPDRKEMPLRFMIREIDALGPETRRTVEAVINSSESPEEVRTELRRLASSHTEQAEASERAPLRTKLSTFSGEEESVPNYVSNLLAAIGKMKVLYLREQRTAIGKEEAQKLLELKMSRGGPQILKGIQETVTALLGVQIDAFKGDASTNSDTAAELDVDNFLVQVNGSGIREALRLVLDFEFQKPQIMLVEEPEMHLHPALETSVMRYLRDVSSSAQVFITTHSTNFLDTGEMKNVFLVSKTRSTQVQSLDAEDAIALLPKELGLRLSSLFMFDRLVFVEGSIDETVIRELASIIGINLGQANVGFITMDGGRNLRHFAATSAFEFLSRRQVNCHILLDRDERTADEIARIETITSGHAAVKILQKREIENYLLVPRALAEFIKSKQKMAGKATAVEVGAVKTALDEAAEKLKTFTSGKRMVKMTCRPHFPKVALSQDDSEKTILEKTQAEIDGQLATLAQMKANVIKNYEEERKFIEESWNSEKFNIVPGDLLIDLVCQAFGVRFKKQRDSARLASFIKDSEIPDELRTVLEEIGSVSVNAAGA